ncbi:hypothetical protein BC938DRAFT_471805 [Jimgerdemannia flammicorona]|uniref:Uncharacterized protein n=1 Tax=Jimgerdemannia flammicorona TaxID=994334 RepID=A0A433Q7B2_9FUNG|nr:hypothetical protein BC938DRAFT_471805 [Jimgerdemannia flammicorona]
MSELAAFSLTWGSTEARSQYRGNVVEFVIRASLLPQVMRLLAGGLTQTPFIPLFLSPKLFIYEEKPMWKPTGTNVVPLGNKRKVASEEPETRSPSRSEHSFDGNIHHATTDHASFDYSSHHLPAADPSHNHDAGIPSWPLWTSRHSFSIIISGLVRSLRKLAFMPRVSEALVTTSTLVRRWLSTNLATVNRTRHTTLRLT